MLQSCPTPHRIGLLLSQKIDAARQFHQFRRNRDDARVFASIRDKGKTMARYYFNIITNDQSFDDTDGLELSDLAAAREEAGGFARDMMRREPARRDWGGHVVRVTAEDRQHLFDLSFLDACS